MLRKIAPRVLWFMGVYHFYHFGYMVGIEVGRQKGRAEIMNEMKAVLKQAQAVAKDTDPMYTA